METLSRAESRHLYSWWRDSRVPKNSKWLQENLADMDARVEDMLKLIEEEGDSFAKKAEMYYKKRPELIRLVEEFYKAYCALAERYDHANGSLRQAQKTMSDAFPNQMSIAMTDESPSGSVTTDNEPRSPVVPSSPAKAFFERESPRKDTPAPSSPLSVGKNGLVSDETDVFARRKGSRLHVGGARRGLILQDHETKGSGNEILNALKGLRKTKRGNEKTEKLQEDVSQLPAADTAEELKMQSKLSESKGNSKVDDEVQQTVQDENKGSGSELSNALKGLRKTGGKEEEKKKKILQEEIEISKLSVQNEDLKTQVKSVFTDKRKVESTEVQLLQESRSKMEMEKDEALLQFQESSRRMASLEAEIEACKIKNTNMLNKISALENAELNYQALKKEKQHLLMEKSTLEQKTNEQQQDLARIQEEVEKLRNDMEEEHRQRVNFESTLASLEARHSQSANALTVSASEIEKGVQLLKKTETMKQSLEEELQRVKEEIQNFSVENASSQQMIMTMHDEISSLKEDRKKLQDEVEHQEGEKRSLEKELENLTEEINHLQCSSNDIIQQIEAVGFKKESFQVSVKELQDSNFELKNNCKREEDKNTLLLEKLEEMQEVSKRNAILDNCLSKAHVELRSLTLKIKELEETCQVLEERNFTIESEKNELVSLVETARGNIEKLTEKNTFLDNSLCDAFADGESLRVRMKNLEESCQSLGEDKSNLLCEKNTLISQVEMIGHNLEDLGNKFTMLQDDHSNLEKQKEDKVNQLFELQDLLKLQKQQYGSFMSSSNARVTEMEHEIHRLLVEGDHREEIIQDKHLKLLAAELEAFVIKKCLYDLKQRNISTSDEWKKMEQHILGQQEKEVGLLDHIERLKKVMIMVWKALNANDNIILRDGAEELYLQYILDKIKALQDSVGYVEEEKQTLLLEKSVYVTLLQQLGCNITDLRSEKNDLYRDCQKKTEELLLLQSEKSELLELNRQLTDASEVCQQRLTIQEEEKRNLGRRALDLQEAHTSSQVGNRNLVSENEVISKRFSKLREDVHLLEEEYTGIFQRAASLDSLSVVFEHFGAQKNGEVNNLNDDPYHSRMNNDGLENKLVEMEEEMTVKLEKCREHLTILAVDMNMAKTVNEELNGKIQQLASLIDNRNQLLIQKDKELAEEDDKVQALQNQNAYLKANLDKIRFELDEVKAVRHELERKISTFVENIAGKEKEIAVILEANETMTSELQRLGKENEGLGAKTSNLLDEVSRCEEEFAAMCSDVQLANVHAVLFEEKMMDLTRAYEIVETFNAVEMEASSKDISSKAARFEELNEKLNSLAGENREMQAELNEYMSIVFSLSISISALENLVIPSRKVFLSDHPVMQVENEKDNTFVGSQGETSEDVTGENLQGVLELQKLLMRIDAIREILLESQGGMVLNYSDGDSSGNLVQERDHGSVTTSRKSTGRYGDMKDIQLDKKISSSSRLDHLDDGSMDNTLTEDLDEDYNHGTYSTEIAVVEEKNEHPPPMDKYVGVDEMIPRRVMVADINGEWDKEVIERLSLDSTKLNSLQKNTQRLKSKMVRLEQSNTPKSFEFEAIRTQLEDLEATILRSVETNAKLTKRAADCDGITDRDDAKNQRKKNRVFEQAHRASVKIETLETKLEKLQDMLDELEKEQEDTLQKTARKKPRILLMDYLYGKREKRRKKEGFRGCFGSTTSVD